jgi:hypothetical protein
VLDDLPSAAAFVYDSALAATGDIIGFRPTREVSIMQQIQVESPLSNKLMSLNGQVVLCDAEGYALGFFQPMGERLKVEDMQLETPLSPEEVERRRKIRTGKSLDEILRKHGL